MTPSDAGRGRKRPLSKRNEAEACIGLPLLPPVPTPFDICRTPQPWGAGFNILGRIDKGVPGPVLQRAAPSGIVSGCVESAAAADAAKAV
jgi:hypothetical protein